MYKLRKRCLFTEACKGKMMLYMINGAGPYRGKHNLDLSALADQCRRELYAKAELAQQDYCWPTESDFLGWLVEHGHLEPVECRSLTAQIDTTGSNAYMPKHWPQCPQCNEGRGSDEFDTCTVKHELNRVVTRLVCPHCGNQWNHREVPWFSDKPMLEDDGRYTEGGCVPYTLSQILDRSFNEVSGLCRNHGWTEKQGMPEDAAIGLLGKLGVETTRINAMSYGHGARLTLGRFLQVADPLHRYIVSTGGHWLAVVNGQNLDQAGTSNRKMIKSVWRIVRS